MKKRFLKSWITLLTAFLLTASGCTDTSISLPERSSKPQSSVYSLPDSTSEPQSSLSEFEPLPAPDASPIDKLLEEMSLEEKIYQMFIVTPEDLEGSAAYVTSADSQTQSALKNTPVGGVVFFAGNLESTRQTRDMLSGFQQLARENNGIGLFLAVDEEGGRVARVSRKLGTYSCKPMAYYGKRLDYNEVYELGKTIGGALGDLGFNVDFAPVADVNINPANELGDRIFSSDADVVAKMTASFVKGAEEQNISATLKHFPGLGAGSGNTHDRSVVIERTLDELTNTEFAAFAGGISAGVDLVMVGHQTTAASGDGLPGDLSPVVVSQWLKKDLGFDGLIVTDAHNMGAIINNYTPAEAAVLAVRAGVDIILMPEDLKAAADGIAAAVTNGEITETRLNESVSKILKKKMELGLLV